MKVRARAPLRLSFGGGGTELSPFLERFGGNVLNTTINLHAYASLTDSSGQKIQFHAGDLETSVEFPLSSNLPINDTTELPLHQAIYNRVVRDYNNGRPLPIRLSTYCDAPVGSGLGSSSTMTVAILKAFDRALTLGLDEYALAQLAYSIEREDLGLQGGYQDQYAAAFGGINFIEFHKNHHVLVNPLRINKSILAELEASLLLYYTGRSRKSARIIERQAEKLQAQDNNVFNQMHEIKDYAITMKEQLLTGNLGDLAETLHQSWLAKKSISSLISDNTIDGLYDHLRTLGVKGGKISGAGGGGYMMLICDPDHLGPIEKALQEEPGHVSRFRFSKDGAQSWDIRY
jgi:D-glycero-alpha-D-manno-heptose-7-phosphate kinase